MKIALVYDWVNKWGGAERVLLALHKIFPQAPLYTAVYDRKTASWAASFKVYTSFLNKLPFAKNNHEFFLPLLPFAFESFDFKNYDVVISVTSSLAKGIVTRPETFHLCYCLTPPRYLYLNVNDYAFFGIGNNLWKAIASKIRVWDQIASQRPDKYLAVSETVAGRIEKYYRKKAEVIYPPVDFEKDEVKPERVVDKFFLIVSRLVPYKRVEIAVEAFNQLNLNLIIVGSGREEKRLKKMAKKKICFLKDLTDGELSWYYRHCQALIMTQEEDLGLSAIEAQSKGTPVIAFRFGGASETVNSKSGCFFYPQNSRALILALRQFKRDKFKEKDCQRNALKFNFESFKEGIIRSINTT